MGPSSPLHYVGHGEFYQFRNSSSSRDADNESIENLDDDKDYTEGCYKKKTIQIEKKRGNQLLMNKHQLSQTPNEIQSVGSRGNYDRENAFKHQHSFNRKFSNVTFLKPQNSIRHIVQGQHSSQNEIDSQKTATLSPQFANNRAHSQDNESTRKAMAMIKKKQVIIDETEKSERSISSTLHTDPELENEYFDEDKTGVSMSNMGAPKLSPKKQPGREEEVSGSSGQLNKYSRRSSPDLRPSISPPDQKSFAQLYIQPKSPGTEKLKIEQMDSEEKRFQSMSSHLKPDKKKSSMNSVSDLKLMKLETFKDWIDQPKEHHNIFNSPAKAIIEESNSPFEEENSPKTGKKHQQFFPVEQLPPPAWNSVSLLSNHNTIANTNGLLGIAETKGKQLIQDGEHSLVVTSPIIVNQGNKPRASNSSLKVYQKSMNLFGYEQYNLSQIPHSPVSNSILHSSSSPQLQLNGSNIPKSPQNRLLVNDQVGQRSRQGQLAQHNRSAHLVHEGAKRDSGATSQSQSYKLREMFKGVKKNSAPLDRSLLKKYESVDNIIGQFHSVNLPQLKKKESTSLKRASSDVQFKNRFKNQVPLLAQSFKTLKKVDREGVALFEQLCDQAMTNVIKVSGGQSNYSSSNLFIQDSSKRGSINTINSRRFKKMTVITYPRNLSVPWTRDLPTPIIKQGKKLVELAKSRESSGENKNKFDYKQCKLPIDSSAFQINIISAPDEHSHQSSGGHTPSITSYSVRIQNPTEDLRKNQNTQEGWLQDDMPVGITQNKEISMIMELPDEDQKSTLTASHRRPIGKNSYSQSDFDNRLSLQYKADSIDSPQIRREDESLLKEEDQSPSIPDFRREYTFQKAETNKSISRSSSRPGNFLVYQSKSRIRIESQEALDRRASLDRKNDSLNLISLDSSTRSKNPQTKPETPSKPRQSTFKTIALENKKKTRNDVPLNDERGRPKVFNSDLPPRPVSKLRERSIIVTTDQSSPQPSQTYKFSHGMPKVKNRNLITTIKKIKLKCFNTELDEIPEIVGQVKNTQLMTQVEKFIKDNQSPLFIKKVKVPKLLNLLKRQSTLPNIECDTNRLIIPNKNTNDEVEETVPQNQKSNIDDYKSGERSSFSNNLPGAPDYHPFHIGQYYDKLGFSPTASSMRTPHDDLQSVIYGGINNFNPQDYTITDIQYMDSTSQLGLSPTSRDSPSTRKNGRRGFELATPHGNIYQTSSPMNLNIPNIPRSPQVLKRSIDTAMDLSKHFGGNSILSTVKLPTQAITPHAQHVLAQTLQAPKGQSGSHTTTHHHAALAQYQSFNQAPQINFKGIPVGKFVPHNPTLQKSNLRIEGLNPNTSLENRLSQNQVNQNLSKSASKELKISNDRSTANDQASDEQDYPKLKQVSTEDPSQLKSPFFGPNEGDGTPGGVRTTTNLASRVRKISQPDMLSSQGTAHNERESPNTAKNAGFSYFNGLSGGQKGINLHTIQDRANNRIALASTTNGEGTTTHITLEQFPPNNINQQSISTPQAVPLRGTLNTLSPHQWDNKSLTTISAISTKVNGKKLINQYVIVQIIGKGKFSKVAQCMDQNTRQVYAMKVMKKSRLKRIMIGKGKAAYSQVEAEVAILKKLNHPNIVKLYEIIDDPKHDKLYLITDYIKNGTLQSRINSKPLPGPGGYSVGLTEDQVRKYFRQLISAVEYCHENARIIHRDIKPENILIDENDDIKLSDFGVSFMIEQNGTDDLESSAGSYYYYSPEACIGTTYKGKKSDLWACGITLYFIVYKRYPFEHNVITELFKIIQNEEPSYRPIKEGILSFPVNPLLKDLIKQILVKNPEDRITTQQIKEHPWVTKEGTWAMPALERERIEATEEEKTNAINRVNIFGKVLLKKLAKMQNGNSKPNAFNLTTTFPGLSRISSAAAQLQGTESGAGNQ